jgi:excisionase family DNA binding protein
MGQDFMTLADVAQRLEVSYRRAHSLAVAGELPAARRGGRWVVPRAAWDAWYARETERALANVRESEAASR